MGFAQVDELNFQVQPLPTPVNGVPDVQYSEMSCPGYPETLSQQGLTHSGNLNVPVVRVKMLYPVGGQVGLSRAEQKGFLQQGAVSR